MATTNAIGNQVTVGNFTIGSGNLLLPTTSATVGQITINAVPFLHGYGTGNTFVGGNAGNFTTTQQNCTGVGLNALHGLTDTGSQCTAVGYNAGAALTTPISTTAIGGNCLSSCTTGTRNTAAGGGCLFTATGSDNACFGANVAVNATDIGTTTAIGSYALQNMGAATSARNIAIGYTAASAYTTTESSNIIIGNAGVIGESNKCRIGAATGSGAGQLTDTYLYGTVHGDTLLTLPTTSSTAGQYQINGTRVLHTYGTGNVFVGTTCGNFTTTGIYNVGVGPSVLTSLAAGANYNVCMGYVSGNGITTGTNNTLIGHSCGNTLSTTGNNTGLGYQALTQSQGSNNVAIGLQAGFNYNTTEANNICIGYTVTGTAAESNVLRIGQGTGVGAGNLNKAVIAGIYNKAVGATAGMVLIDSTDVVGSVPYVPTTAWTPQLNFGGAHVDMTFGTQTGSYSRLGSVVTYTCTLVLTEKGSSVGAATITGLPVAAAATSAGAMRYSEITTTTDKDLTASVTTSTISLFQTSHQTGAAEAALTDAELGDTSTIIVSGTYLV